MKADYFKKNKLPDSPGVYFFLKGKEIIYIGKATSLRSRAKSYFGKDLIATRGPLLVDMVFKADTIDWQTTDSVLEALILEANLIKKHQPIYNTKEKSDKSFNYVCITKPASPRGGSSTRGGEELPKVTILRGKELLGIENFSGLTLPRLRGGTHTVRNFQYRAIFGPFPNSSQLKEAVKIVRRIFPFLDEKSKNYLEFYKQINLVPDLNDRKLYLQNIKNIILFFSGKKQQIFRNLKKEMNTYAKLREFEKAGEIKRQLFALQHINDVALIKSGRSESMLPEVFRIEAYDIAHMGGKNMVGVMVVVSGGEIEKSEYKKFKIRTQENANDTGALKEVLERRLAHNEWIFPNLIVVDGGKAQVNTANRVLSKLNLDIPVVSVLKDERHKPKAILGDKRFGVKYEREILLANSEAHRFAIAYHKNMRNKNFLRTF